MSSYSEHTPGGAAMSFQDGEVSRENPTYIELDRNTGGHGLSRRDVLKLAGVGGIVLASAPLL
ncbi:MAG TPA: twin-arginine translocation signal domain-containing protein [Chloroflexota bacterium]|nr:twin-arginine translocation signal domain-containing protein [Chloroflexota bacterium]